MGLRPGGGASLLQLLLGVAPPPGPALLLLLLLLLHRQPAVARDNLHLHDATTRGTAAGRKPAAAAMAARAVENGRGWDCAGSIVQNGRTAAADWLCVWLFPISARRPRRPVRTRGQGGAA